MTSFSDIERIVARYDTATTELDQAVSGRIADSLDASYRNLERELRRLYPTWQSDGSLFAVQRRLLLMEQLGEVLQVVRPEMQGEYERLFTEALQISHESGGSMADELIRARDPGYPLQEFTTVPIEAAIAQARDGVQRLYRYNDEFKTSVSGVVEQGLLQGWGADKVARILRGNEQMQGRFGAAQLKSKAETIARTEIMSAFGTATQERYERNGLLVQVLNSPSERLCAFCLARHGNVYEVGQISVPFHPRCRDILAPFSRKWQERGWTDDAAVEADKRDRLEEMAKLGTKPNAGPTYWERRAGLTEAPQPVWKPGDAVKPPKVEPKPPKVEPKPPKVEPKPPKVEPKPQPGTTRRTGDPNKDYFDEWLSAWPSGTTKGVTRIVEKLPYASRIASQPGEDAYQLGRGIHIATYSPGWGEGNAVWRHEYGHYIDAQLGRRFNKGPDISASATSLKAMRADESRLLKLQEEARRQMREDLQKGIEKAYDPKANEYSAQELQRAGIEKTRAENLALSPNPPKPEQVVSSDFPTPFSVRKATERRYQENLPEDSSELADLMAKVAAKLPASDLTPAKLIRARAAIAARYQDPELMLMLAEQFDATRHEGQRPQMLEDLVGSITLNKVGQGHADDYYYDPVRQSLEAWANSFYLLSSGDPQVIGMGRQLAPNYLRFVEETIEETLKKLEANPDG